MTQTTERQFLPALLGALHQEGASGELTLVQNDAERRLFWDRGHLVYLKSDAAGEQLGNYMIRQGILDHGALRDLLASPEDGRFGDKVVQGGFVSEAQRNQMLQCLLEQILLHALEHKVVSMSWEAGPIASKLSADLRFRLDHRRLVWETFQQIVDLTAVEDLLFEESSWKWRAKGDVLVDLSDLPLTPETAYALSLLGLEPISFETFLSITQMTEDDAARLMVTLWALGSLTLAEGELPRVDRRASPGAQADPANFSTGEMPVFGRGPSTPEAPVRMQPPPDLPPPPPVPEVQAPVAPPPPIPIPASWSEIPLPPQPAAFQPPLPQPSGGETWGTLPSRTQSAQPPVPVQPSPVVFEDPFLERPLQREDATDPGANAEASPATRARVRVREAKVAMLQERTAEAIRALEDAVRLDPDSPRSYEAWLLLGKLRLTNPAWGNRAIEALQQATRINPLSADPWVVMGEVYHRKGFLPNATECYRKALTLDPSVPVPADVDLSHPAASQEVEEKPGSGLVHRLKGLFGK